MPSPSPSRCIDSVISPKSDSIDHSYSGIPSKTKTQSLDHLYSTTVNQNVDLNNPYSFHKKKILMPPEINALEMSEGVAVSDNPVLPNGSCSSREKHGIAAMYALGMYLRNNHMIAFQKAVAASCIRYNAGNGLMEF
ncbi:hypothetical protein DPMN_011000 [Dreissena polymorpha]|uniref:Uncharacterized protein n=1 Tax=Dreissena polymorpha TaxID=45954 RepID=A0A9D4MZR1_DREPO|nr:hypothetical protein DPMN_011000 [Dreissena polymorpha]